MPTFEFYCPTHGAFDVAGFSFGEGVPSKASCECGKASPRVLTPPAAVFVEGGTGAGRGYAQARKEALWNERASEQQHDPYTQSKAQLTNMYKSESDRVEHGDRPTPVSEAAIQVGAEQIDKQAKHPKPDLQHRHLQKVRQERKRKEVN